MNTNEVFAQKQGLFQIPLLHVELILRLLSADLCSVAVTAV